MFRKTMLFAAATLLFVPAMVSAQQVTASATVAPTANVTGTGDLDFGSLDGTGDVTIDPTDAVAVRTVTFNHDVNVRFENVATNLVSNGVNLPVSLTCATQLGVTWSAVSACATAVLPLNVGTSTSTATISFGGTILGADVLQVPAGTYTGTLTIVVEAQ